MTKKSHNFSSTKRILKNKKILYAFWRAESRDDSPYHNWYVLLEKIFGRFIVFDTSKIYFRYGKKILNKRLLDIVRKEQPDYVFFSMVYDEIDIESIKAIRQISPCSQIINLCSDGDWRFEDFSRFYAPFFDYSILMQDARKSYKQDGIKNIVFWFWAYNCEILRPLQLKKKYDVTFIGRPRDKYRVEYIKYLIDKGINVRVWGDGWAKYPELKEHYGGYLPIEGLVRVINETKINLSFGVGGYGTPQMKGHLWEISACKAFALVEYYKDYKKFLKEGKEIIMFKFKNKEDMLEKIKYYLSHEKEREEIAARAYKKVVTNHNQTIRIFEFFQKTLKQKPARYLEKLPLLKKRFIALSYDDLMEKQEHIQKKLENADYVYFKDKSCKSYPYRDNMQAYSLEKSSKNISCCDYYVYCPILGNYLLFKASQAFNLLKQESFTQVANLYQLMFTKGYFLKNISRIIAFAKGKKTNLFLEKDITFVSIPLMEINKAPPQTNYDTMKIAFQMKFLDKLYSLYFQKKLLFNPYPYALIFKSMYKERFIFQSLYENIFDKSKIMKIKEGHLK